MPRYSKKRVFSLNIYRSILEITGVVLKNETSLPYFQDKNQNKNFDDSDLLENERKGLGYHTGFRQLPYTPQDNYTRDLVQQRMNVIVMENDFLRATFLADYGARLWSLYDKRAGRELLFSNPVFRLGNLAIRNAWFSGGIEWNLGYYGHTCLTCEPMFFACCTGENGEQFLRVYEYERQNCIIEQMDFHLPDDSGRLFAHIKILNTKEEKMPLYWWTNIAVKEEHNVRVFSASDEIIRIKPEVQNCQNSVHGFAHDKMPYLKNLKGVDVSYPQSIPYSNEYFFQNRALASDTWEAAAYNDGTAFWERSTPILRYRKMFCWGNQRGGTHWKDYLSVDGKGNYIEIQAGLAPTQVHGMDISPKGCVRFTQAFGGMNICNENTFADWESSKNYIHSLIDRCLSEDALAKADRKFTALEDVTPDQVLYFGSGWGALESMRDPDIIPKSVVFPRGTLGREQKPWLELLQIGKIPELEKGCSPDAWITDYRWAEIIVRSLKNEENKNAAAYLHLGLMLYENGKRMDGILAMKRSVQLSPTAICYRNLAQAMLQEGDKDEACEYMEKCIFLCGAEQLGTFELDAIDIFTAAGCFSRAWSFYDSLPNYLKSDDRICLRMAKPALEMKQWEFLEKQFTKEFAGIHEGDTTLLDIWYIVQAMCLAKKRGEADFQQFLNKVKTSVEPPFNLDFRMSDI
jgi:hypothetical protein